MSRSRTAQLVMIAVLVLMAAACTPQEPDVSVNEQVAAEDRATEAPEGGATDGATGGEAGGGETVEWAAGNELAFDVAPETVPAGTPLTFELTLTGLPHNVIIEDANGDEPIVEGESAGTYTGEVTLEAGEYTYYCGVPGHRAAGMEGQLTAA